MSELNFQKTAHNRWAAPVEQGEVLITAGGPTGEFCVGYKPRYGLVIDFGRASDYEAAVVRAQREWDNWPLK